MRAIPRLFQNTSTPVYNASKPNEVIQFDPLFLGKSVDEIKYVLFFTDDFSGYVWIIPTTSATASHATGKLSRCRCTFPSPSYWISDQGAHFINDLLQAMADAYNMQHNPTVAYSQWVNNTVERLNIGILSAMRAMQGS